MSLRASAFHSWVCQEDIKNVWMGHKPRTMSEMYSHLFEEVEIRLAESAQVGVGFDIPPYVVPNCSKRSMLSEGQVNTQVVVK